jgi:hypothetical protein
MKGDFHMDFNINTLQAYIKAKDFHPELKEKYFLKLVEEVGELALSAQKSYRHNRRETQKKREFLTEKVPIIMRENGAKMKPKIESSKRCR